MEKLLQAALASDLPTGQVVRWLEGDDGALHLQQDIYTDLAPGSSACLRREAFETFLLNYVRDQAELILSTAEKRTAGSRGGTPQPTDATTAPSSEAAPGKTKAKSKLGEKDLHRLESVARRLEPGAVDDNNFPALGAPATKRLTPVAIAPAHVKRLVAANATDSTSGTGTSGGNTPKRRIVPTTVKEVEVSKDFVTAPLATSRPSTPQQAFGSFETAQRQGVSGQLDADWLASSVAHLESRLSAATIDAPPSPSEPHDRGPSSIKSSQNHGTGGQAPAKDAGTAGKGASDAVGMDLQSPDTAGTAVFTHESFREGGRAAEMDASLATIEGRRAPARAAVEEAHSQAGSVAPMPASPQVKLPSPDATSAAASPAGRPAPVALSPSAATLAQLHGAVLRTSTAAPLSEEIELLLNLLAVPVEVEVDAALASAPHLTVLLWCGTLAQQYAALVLHHAGHLVRALGVQLLESICSAQVLVGDAATRSAAVRSFREGAQSALAELRSQQLRSEKAYDSVRAFGAAGSLFGLPAFTSDARKSKSPDEQRRLSNREATRDAWFALMRDTAAKTASFGHSGGRGGSMGTASLASGMDHAGGGEEPDGVVLGRLQARASDLLRALRPDNFGPFAELFTAAVLQAAATGEALLDEELTNLAKRNVDRFHSLNRRMQGQGQGPGPRRGSALQGQQQRRPPHGFGDLGGSAALKPAAKGKRPSSAGGGGGAFGGYVASDEAVTAALEVVAEFPRPLRLHALFLEAADSHRLNTNLVRWAGEMNEEIWGDEHLGPVKWHLNLSFWSFVMPVLRDACYHINQVI